MNNQTSSDSPVAGVLLLLGILAAIAWTTWPISGWFALSLAIQLFTAPSRQEKVARDKTGQSLIVALVEATNKNTKVVTIVTGTLLVFMCLMKMMSGLASETSVREFENSVALTSKKVEEIASIQALGWALAATLAFSVIVRSAVILDALIFIRKIISLIATVLLVATSFTFFAFQFAIGEELTWVAKLTPAIESSENDIKHMQRELTAVLIAEITAEDVRNSVRPYYKKTRIPPLRQAIDSLNGSAQSRKILRGLGESAGYQTAESKFHVPLLEKGKISSRVGLRLPAAKQALLENENFKEEFRAIEPSLSRTRAIAVDVICTSLGEFFPESSQPILKTYVQAYIDGAADSLSRRLILKEKISTVMEYSIWINEKLTISESIDSKRSIFELGHTSGSAVWGHPIKMQAKVETMIAAERVKVQAEEQIRSYEYFKGSTHSGFSERIKEFKIRR